MDKTSKLSTTFNRTPHVMEKLEGEEILVRHEETGQRLRRNVIHLKRVEGQWKSVEEGNDSNGDNIKE